MTKKKASLGLQDISSVKKNEPLMEDSLVSTKKNPKLKQDQKQRISLYIDPLLHEALHSLVFSERHKKTTFQTVFIEGLDLLLEKKGLPSVEEINRGEKTINP